VKRAANIGIPETLKEVCDPDRLALVVYDMQIGILKQIKNPQDIIAQVSKRFLPRLEPAAFGSSSCATCHCPRN
jgi:hypothetical protein